MSAREAGFTLVEMMVALAIFGLLSAAGVGLLAFSVRAQAASAERLDGTAAYRRVDALLTADLAQAMSRRTRDEAGRPLPAFAGDAVGVEGTGMTFVRAGWTNPDGRPRASVQKVAWAQDGDRLVRRTWPMLDGAAPGVPVVLLRGVSGFALRYRFADGRWHDRWDVTEPATLPRLVEATITIGRQAPLRALYLVGTGA